MCLTFLAELEKVTEKEMGVYFNCPDVQKQQKKKQYFSFVYILDLL
jgi:hypothetical protein